MCLAGISLENLSSVYLVKPGQSAKLKLMKVLLGAFVFFMVVDSFISIGRWSKPRVVSVDQLQDNS